MNSLSSLSTLALLCILALLAFAFKRRQEQRRIEHIIETDYYTLLRLYRE